VEQRRRLENLRLEAEKGGALPIDLSSQLRTIVQATPKKSNGIKRLRAAMNEPPQSASLWHAFAIPRER
jgi:hypothetical protein